MATPESIGKSDCQNCGDVVHVALNRGGFAYYKCGECGFEGRHHVLISSRKYIAEKVRKKPGIPGAPPGQSAANVAPVAASEEAVTAATPVNNLPPKKRTLAQELGL